jgi:hypothetical protein
MTVQSEWNEIVAEGLNADDSISQFRLTLDLELVKLFLQQNRKPDAIHQFQDFLKAFTPRPQC